MSHTVIGIFRNREQAREAIQHLYSAGFNDSNVDLSVQKSEDRSSSEDTSDKVSHFFDNLFGDNKEDSRRHTEAGRRGTIVTVHARSSEQANLAAKTLDHYGAMDVNESGEERGREGSHRSGSGSESDTIPVIEENLNVGKREVETGGVRIKSRIVERPVEETIRLRNEQVTVERRPVDRAATDEELKNFKEGTEEVTEKREVPVVSKDKRVVEEVNLNKEVDEREETIKDTVRGTKVETDEYDENDPRRKKGHNRGDSPTNR